MSSGKFLRDGATGQWCVSVANPECPGYRRFVALSDGVSPPDDADVKPAQALAGRVALVSFFVDRPDSSWVDAEICDIFRAVGVCANWLTRQASRYRTNLETRSDSLYYHTSDSREELVPIGFQTVAGRMVPVEAQSAAETLALPSYWVHRLGFADIVRFMGHVQRSVDADSWVVLFHPREAGRSFAVPAYLSLHRCVELAICYPQNAGVRRVLRGPLHPNPAVYAHELLHLFGATDKYDVVSLEDFPCGSVTECDIMRVSSRRLKQLRIDPLTAAEIGWPTDVG
jgi:hypothetical protein